MVWISQGLSNYQELMIKVGAFSIGFQSLILMYKYRFDVLYGISGNILEKIFKYFSFKGLSSVIGFMISDTHINNSINN